MAKKLWSMTTTVRNPYRVTEFLATLQALEGWTWDDATQIKFQGLLIKNRLYSPTESNLSQEQAALLGDPLQPITEQQAGDIFAAKKYVDAPMRGRNSFTPLRKLGLANIIDDKVYISALGYRLLRGEIGIEDVNFTSLLKWQYPNPTSVDFHASDGYNTKPFVTTLHLIGQVNTLCRERGEKAKGISREEFGLFALSLIHYENTEKWANALLDYRYKKEAITDYADKQAFYESTVATFLADYVNASITNIRDYSDNVIRYFRLTKYIYIRGGGYYIDLEPRRAYELGKLLEADNGAAKPFNEPDYIAYLSDYESYHLPWKTVAELQSIAQSIICEISELQTKLHLPKAAIPMAATVSGLEEQIQKLREGRTRLQNLHLKQEYAEIAKINEAIYALSNIRHTALRPSIALERWANIALNIINDAVLIKPNYPVGDDNEPTFTAPPGTPDIECFYDGFAGICEVTMLTGRDQWYNEGQPVQRHLRDFESKHSDTESYCLFVAPTIHRDTLNTFWNAVKYEYEGKKQKIIPLKIDQLILILEKIKTLKAHGQRFVKDDLRSFYERAVDIRNVQDSGEWMAHIGSVI